MSDSTLRRDTLLFTLACWLFVGLVALIVSQAPLGPPEKASNEGRNTPPPLRANIKPSESVYPYPCVYHSECLKMAEMIYYEARGEDLIGYIAVGWVVLNRIASPHFPDSVVGVISYRCHFEYRCSDKTAQGFSDFEAYLLALRVAEGLLSGCYPDPTGGADHYYAPKGLTEPPHWATVYPLTATIGNHHFHERIAL